MRRLVTVLTLLTACGGDGREPSSPSALFPLVVGASWRYRVTDAGSGAPSVKLQRVAAAGEDGTFELVSERGDDVLTRSWQAWTEVGLVRYRESTLQSGAVSESSSYEPHKLRLPAGLDEVGAQATQLFLETTYDAAGVAVSRREKSETWTVEAATAVTVPGGTFARALLLHRLSVSSDKRFWFVEGVGKVKEEGAGQLEELVEWTIP